MRLVAAMLLLAAAACSKEQPKSDSASAGASASAAAPALTPSDTSRAPDTPAAKSAAAQGDPVQKTVTPSRTGTTTPRPTGGRTGTAPRPGSSGDVIQGRVAEHGADPLTFLAITPSSGAQIRLAGSQIAALGSVQGADVWARGRRDGDSFIVDTFEVRRANDRPVEDGIVSVAGTTVTVRTARATLTYADAPTDLRNAAGARVWITPPVAGQAPSFGIIRTPTKQIRR